MAQCTHCFREKNTNGACPFCGYDERSQAGKYPLALRPGSILNGRYIVGHVIGQGGFGITYIAQDYQTKERVAVKEYLPTELAGRTSDGLTVQVYSGDRAENFLYGKEQFLAEAKTLAAFIGDAHIVRIHSYFEENGTAYFVMEYVDGLPLDKYMAERGGRLTPEEANRLLLPLMKSLETVHAKGIVHRDIAPDNIIVSRDGSAKLIDFGAARYSTGEKSRSLDIILKHGFAPYEQYMRRGRQGPWTDVYALAATFYYAITGKIPPEAIERRDDDLIIPPSNLGVDLNYRAEEVLGEALEVLAKDRYQSMAEFHRDMEQALTGELQTARAAREQRDRLAREEAERQERERQERLARERAEREEKARREREAKAEAERLKKEEKEHLAREKAERRERERREKEERKAVREAAKAERQTADAGEKKKTKLPLLLAAALVLALAIFGMTKFTGNRVSGSTAQTEEAVTEPPPADAAIQNGESQESDGTGAASPGELKPLAEADVGDTVLFGAYEQDNDENNGKEPIEWLVLDKQDARLLVISRYALDRQPYNNEFSDFDGRKSDKSVTWETCFLRAWLNEDFLNTAFTENEQNKIPEVTVNADSNPEYDTDPGATTTDQIFLLSIPEAEEYFGSNEDRRCAPSPYAIAQGINYDDDWKTDGRAACMWWLRSPGVTSLYAADVRCFGSINFFGDFPSSSGEERSSYAQKTVFVCAVRPAMWIKVGDDAVSDNSEIQNTTDVNLLSRTAVGDTIIFGAYEQDNNEVNGEEPIEWQVLDKQGSRILVISKYALDCLKNKVSYGANGNWEYSGIRGWLNSTFLKEAFQSEERSMIPGVTVTAESNPEYDRNPGRDTEDQVFLLSIREVEKYFPQKGDRLCIATEHAIHHNCSVDANQHCGWYLRSPGDGSDSAVYVEYNGILKFSGTSVYYGSVAVRPAMWIDLSA